jgi:four helix bundle protein
MSDTATEQKTPPIEATDLFRAYVAFADRLWNIVGWWTPLAADTVGKQLIRAADSIPANLIQGDKCPTDMDALSFLLIARASARETRYWLQRAHTREILTAREAEELLQSLTDATRLLNTLIHTRRNAGNSPAVREQNEPYLSLTDPFLDT